MKKRYTTVFIGLWIFSLFCVFFYGHSQGKKASSESDSESSLSMTLQNKYERGDEKSVSSQKKNFLALMSIPTEIQKPILPSVSKAFKETVAAVDKTPFLRLVFKFYEESLVS